MRTSRQVRAVVRRSLNTGILGTPALLDVLTRHRHAWTATSTSFAIDVRIPGNATSTVDIPDGTCSTVTERGRPADQAPGVESLGTSNGYAGFNIGSGTYHFRCGR